MKKIIVTGGSGFIGSHLIDFLLKKKYFVINIDKTGYSSNPYNVKKFKNKRNYLFFKADINNRKVILNILKKFRPNGVYNLAAETHVDRSIDNPKNFITSNIFGVYNLMEAIRNYQKNSKKKIKLLHISTDEVYGDIPKKKSADENFNYNPSSPYSASKAGADHIINKKPLPLYGSGKNIREWIYVEDTCVALLKIFAKGKIGESYNIGTGIRVSNIAIIKMIISIAKNIGINIGDKTKIQYVVDRPGHDKKYSLNSYKIKNKLNWKYKIKIKNGLKKTFLWYLNNSIYFKKISKANITKRFGLKI